MHPAERIFSQHPGLETKLGSHHLSPRDLRFVVRAVHDVADKWEGIALCLRVKDIDQIKRNYRGAGKRMIAVLSAWLRGQTLDNEPPSWKKVVWVVADRVGGDNPAHAERILLNYERFSQYTPSAMASEADSSPFVQRGASEEDIKSDIKSKANDLQKELDEVEHRWYQLGVLLGLPVHTLDGYQENYDELRDRLRVMLQEWLKKGNMGEYEVPSWQVLVDAVEHSAGGENPRLAAKLATKRVGGTPDTAAGSTSSSAGATVPPMQSSAQQSTPLTSGQPPSMHQAPPSQLGQQQSTHQAPLSYQGQQPQMPITSQFQQPIVAGVPQMQLQPGNQYPPQQGTLKPTEKQLMIELHNTVANNWRPIGTFLEIPIGELNTIAERERGDPQRCLMDMLRVWLHRLNPPASWPAIAVAVEFTGRPDIAQQIRQKYCMSGMQPQPAGPVYNQPTMYSAQQHMPQPQPYAQTQGQPFQQPQFSASTTYPQLQQPGQQWYGMPQQNVTVQAPQQMQPTGQPQIPPGMYAQQFYFQPAPQVPMQQQQQAGNYPIPQQQQSVSHVQQPFASSVQTGHLPQQPPQSQPQQMSSLPPHSSTSQTSPTDFVGTPNTAAGSTSSSASETVPPMQSPAQQSTPQPSMQQASPSYQGQQSQMPITSQFQQPTGVLTSKDLHNLTTIMKPAAPKWKTIGDTLGILDSDLNIIQSSPMLMLEAPASYFREMLSQWLKWAPPNHSWPTLEALETALRSSGHEDLALELKPLFLKNKK